MEQWLKSIYTDGTKYFVSNPLPRKGEEVTISIRMLDGAPIKGVILRTKLNGIEHLLPMEKYKVKNNLAYYKTSVKVYEDVLHYHFYIPTENIVYYYTQKEITTYIPDETYDFKILVDYKQPSWVKESVFYQIFPDRFCNGNKELDIKSGEYTFDGHETIHVDNWDKAPGPYNENFCLDFYGGDLVGVKNKIPYLKELGVNAIYLNPIFYGATVHKYDCLDYFKVDPHLGGDEALAELTDELHKNNMKIILDVSINHTGIANKWFNKEGVFFDKSIGAYNNKDSKERKYYFFKDNNEYKAWFDVETLPTLNYTSKELREIIYESEDSLVKKWLKPPYSIDGWRFDVADTMARNNELQLHHEVWPGINKSVKEVNENAYILAEDWSDCSEFLKGNEWDSPMNYYGSAKPIREFLGETDLSSMKSELLQNIKYKPTAKDLSSRIMEHLSKLPTVIQENQFNLLDSHDVPRLHNNKNISFEEYRGAVIMIFTLIGCTSVYYGDEVGLDGRRNDMEGCRYPMNWNVDLDNSPYYNLYSKLANIKRNNKAFTEGGFKIISNDDYVFSYARFTEDTLWIMVISNDNKERKIEIPINIFGKNKFNKLEDEFGKKLNYEMEEGKVILKVLPNTSYIFEV
ncbi:alpha-amylase family glycosyl hydrolase [uncultured Clostridium sp.]|uniref:alpha-amylase family glycosyl hydrolase n=1 Tax=uncultured Clostridium sp. TaxID=59620 RepID=UPI0025FC2A2F|nr:alpha-amylase family glycosyl hydrolase [uncultured Clostridium sp.]